MRKRLLVILVGVGVLATTAGALAQNGKSNTKQGGTPNGRPFETLAAEVTTLQMRVAAIRQQETSLASLQSQLDALAMQVAGNTASIEELHAYNALQDQKIASLGGAVLALEAAMIGVQTDLQAFQLHGSLMEQWLAALEQQWTNAEARLVANTADIQLLIDADRALQEYAAGLQQQILFTSSLATDAQSTASNAQLRLNDLQAQLNTKQSRIQTACPVGSSIRQIDLAGNVACEFDDGGSGGGVLSVAETWTSQVAISPNSSTYAYAYCPSGYLSMGGGFAIPATVHVFYNTPFLTNGWVIAASNPYAFETSFYASVRCALISN